MIYWAALSLKNDWINWSFWDKLPQESWRVPLCVCVGVCIILVKHADVSVCCRRAPLFLGGNLKKEFVNCWPCLKPKSVSVAIRMAFETMTLTARLLTVLRQLTEPFVLCRPACPILLYVTVYRSILWNYWRPARRRILTFVWVFTALHCHYRF